MNLRLNSSYRAASAAFALLALTVLPIARSKTDRVALSDMEAAARADRSDENTRSLAAIAAVREAIASGHLAEAQQYLASLRGTALGSQQKYSDEITALIGTIRTRAEEQASARDAEIDRVLTDTMAKFMGHAPASDYDDLLKRLFAVSGPRVPSYDPNGQKFEAARSFITRCQDYTVSITDGNPSQAVSVLNELIQFSAQLPVIPRSQLTALRTDMAKSPPKDDAAKARYEALRAKLVTVIDNAQSASDFDDILMEIAKPDPTPGNYSGMAYPTETLRRYARRWQDYFAALAAGNDAKANGVLDEITNDSNADAIYPRSHVLARRNGRRPGDAVETNESPITLDQLTLATLDKFAQQIADGRTRGPGFVHGFTALQSEVQRIQAAVIQLKLGNAQPAVSLANPSIPFAGSPYASALARIENELILQALPTWIEAPKTLVPSPEDTPRTYLEHAVAQGRQTKNWKLVYRALMTLRNLAPGDISGDVLAYNFFFIAMNEEAAEQWSDAVRDYRTALRYDAPELPVEEISVRLARIKAAHPAEYEKGESAQRDAENSRFSEPYGPTVPSRFRHSYPPFNGPPSGQVVPAPVTGNTP